MLYFLGEWKEAWGPLRLFESFTVLLGLALFMTAALVHLILPRVKERLPRDRGRAHAEQADKSKGKPQGAGLVFIPIAVLVGFLTIPFSLDHYLVLLVVLVAMWSGYADDASVVPWGALKKGLIDLVIAAVTAGLLCWLEPVVVWLPFLKGPVEGGFLCPVYLFMPIATVILWVMINSTNCTDGVDGLAGVLSVIPLVFIAMFLYVIGGHEGIAEYLLVPHDPEGAPWAVFIMSFAGALSAYLWYNAEPSQLLMGDAGSRAIGLVLGIAILKTGNFFLGAAVAPVILINGGAGLVKLGLLRMLKALKVSIENHPGAPFFIRALHKVRFPLHDYFRKKYYWSNAQVLMRFALVQTWTMVILFSLFLKMR